MEKLTRRKLITQVSVGAGAAGVLAVTAACASSDTTQVSENSLNAPFTPNATNDPIAVFVTDPAKGTLKIIKGDREIIVNNPSLASSLLALA
jgi:hypothetical protein